MRLKQVSKEYTNAIYNSQKQYKSNYVNKLRNLKNSNSREYWRILNANQPKAKVQANLKDLYKYFNDINQFEHESDNNDGDDEINNNDDNNNNTSSATNDETEFVLNEPITESEMSKAIQDPSNKKASGHDYIKNEHVITTSNIL